MSSSPPAATSSPLPENDSALSPTVGLSSRSNKPAAVLWAPFYAASLPEDPSSNAWSPQSNNGSPHQRLSTQQATAPPSDSTDLVEALLAVLQNQGSHHHHNPHPDYVGVSDDATETRATSTTATPSPPTPSAKFDCANLSDARSGQVASCDRHVRLQPPNHLDGNAAASTEAAVTAASHAMQHLGGPDVLSSYLTNETASHWSGLSEILSSLLATSASVSGFGMTPGNEASPSFQNVSAGASNSGPHNDNHQLTIENLAGFNDATAAASSSGLSTPGRENSACSLITRLSSAVAAQTSPTNTSLASNLSSVFLGDRATVGGLVSILSPSGSLSGIATPPTMKNSDLASPTTGDAVRRSSISNRSLQDDQSSISSPSHSVPVLPTIGTSTSPNINLRTMGLDRTNSFSSSLLSPTTSKTLSAFTISNSGDAKRNRRVEGTTTGVVRKPFGEVEKIPGSEGVCNSSSEEGEPSCGTPRSSLFLGDGSLNLEFFKVYPCKNVSHVHDRKNCPFHHSQRDRRRQPVTYNAEQCDDHFDLEKDFSCICPNGDNCDKCHNRHELLYHPCIYKQRFCSSYTQLECHRGRLCAFAHTREEIRCELFTEREERLPKSDFFMKKFKTLWCPYGVQHDWHGCLYAHTYQDCRRSPNIGYGSEPCPYWQKDLHSADYQKRCPFGPRCPYSHGSKEQLYHPAYYKTMPCADYKTRRQCPRNDLCAFYHDISEKRPAPASTVDGTAEDCEGNNVYDYTKPIPTRLMNLLQPNFMRPPLFNLDDFEAFGHASRVGSDRRESHGNDILHPSNARPSTFPSIFYQESPIYPSFRHQSSFFREGVNTPASAPTATYSGCYRPQQQHAFTITGLHGNNRRAANMPNAYDPSSHALYNPLQHQGCHLQVLPNSNAAQLLMPPQQRLDDRFQTAAGNRRTLARPQPEQRSLHSPSLWPAACTRYNQKGVANLCGRPRESMRFCPISDA